MAITGSPIEFLNSYKNTNFALLMKIVLLENETLFNSEATPVSVR